MDLQSPYIQRSAFGPREKQPTAVHEGLSTGMPLYGYRCFDSRFRYWEVGGATSVIFSGVQVSESERRQIKRIEGIKTISADRVAHSSMDALIHPNFFFCARSNPPSAVPVVPFARASGIDGEPVHGHRNV